MFGDYLHTVQKSEQAAVGKLRTEQLPALADAHAHIDLLKDDGLLKESINRGVGTIVTCGVDYLTSVRALELSDYSTIFPEVGLDPENALLSGNVIDAVCELAKKNSARIVGIGEIGLDFKKAASEMEREKQREAFKSMIELGMALDKPLTVHSRDSIKEVLGILKDSGAKKVQLHYFEGDDDDARTAAELGYYISVPPLESRKRASAIKNFPIELLMTETDTPVVGKAPYYVEVSVRIVADVKGIDYYKAAEILTENTKRFFKINAGGMAGSESNIRV